ncbi:FAD/NAD(P)-binding oxidoreductase family protein [Heracleum sosnowskyi]|uniref:FAD/NAD(P)-binding oxidoreductase family protein n=1 Tax=Heracleum sosnowskyi TaxID=360622 RepID=A0AAD8HIC0_9APIA|nr:FAD/NAD(P)-binding oxidoreductase family protein [Heracleum sosnowskyi]
MNRVAVIGSGISGAVCAWNLAGKNGVSVTVFESARGPGGRMSGRRETTEDGKELVFDHGAPYFTATNADVRSVVGDWEARGLVAEWKESFGSFDFISKTFSDYEKDGSCKKFVGIPKMNSICRALVSEPGVETKFGVGVGLLEWLEDEGSWSLNGLDGQNLGHFKGVVASDKSVFSPRFRNATGRPPPLDLNLVPELASKIKEVPVDPCFALMLAFEQPLSSIPLKGFSFLNSKVLSRAYHESSKPGRSTQSENWVLHSTAEYAENVIAQTGLQKLPAATLDKIAEELFQEFRNTGLSIPRPFFKRAHRWGSAFPAARISEEENCLWDGKKRLAICGDFCVGPNVEGAILSGLAAASKFNETFSCL